MVKTTSKYIRIINGELKVLRLKKSTNSENLFSISQRFAYCKARVLSSISKLFVIRNVGSCRPCSLKITWRTLRLVRGSMTSLSYILNLLNLRFSFFRSTLIPVSYTHLRAHETDSYLVCRLLLEKKKINFLL